MNPNHFDTISKLFASRTTRRGAIAGGLGLATAGVTSRALAQGATPEVATATIDPNDPHPSADEARTDPEFLFVQPFDAGTWAPKADDTYTLTLTGAAAHTVYFSDRPERIVGLAPTQDFLDGLGFTPENPPNAAIVARREGSDEQEILVIELRNPVYDPDTETLIYDAVVLADYGEPGLAHLAQRQQDYELGETFGAGGLFIDDCDDFPGYCYQTVDGENQDVGPLGLPQYWDTSFPPTCEFIDSDGSSRNYGTRCAEAYPDQCFYKYSDDFGAYWWNCYVRTSQQML